MDMKKLIENSKSVGSNAIEIENDISKEIIAEAKKIYLKHPDYHPWWRGVDMINRLKKLGKANVRNHMEKLVDKGTLESGLHGNKKVYRLRVIEESDEDD